MSQAERIAMLTVTALETMGRFKDAEKTLLEYVQKLGPEERDKRGVLHIDLGQIAEKDERQQDAVRYFQKAIHLLADLKGDALLQAAHANFNLARVYYNEGNFNACVTHAKSSLSIYEMTPLATAADRLGAKILMCLGETACNGTLDFVRAERLMHDLWRGPIEKDDGVIRSLLTLYVLYDRLEARDLRAFYRKSFAWDHKLILDVLNDVRAKMVKSHLSRPSVKDDPATDGDTSYRKRFTDSEWSDIECMMVGIFLHVTQGLKDSRKRAEQLEQLVVEGESASASAFIRELAEGMKGGDLLTLFRRSTKLSRESHEQVKDILRSKLSKDEMKRFSGALFAELWNLATRVDGEVTDDARRRLMAFAMYLEVDVVSIPVKFFAQPERERRLHLATFHEEFEMFKAIEISGVDLTD